MTRRALPPLAALLFAGCATQERGHIPSLAPREAETRGFAEPAAAPPTVAAPDPTLDARIAELTGAGSRTAEAFRTARAGAETKVAAAAGAAPGSDAWLDAQVALGGLDVQRAGASETVTALEQLAADRAVAGEPPYPALAPALAAARADLAEIGEAIAALTGRLRR